MKVNTNNSTKITIGQLNAGDCFEQYQEYFMVVYSDRKAKVGHKEVVNLAGGYTDYYPTDTEVNKVNMEARLVIKCED